MARSLLLWSIVVLLSIVLRAAMRPVYVGQIDESTMPALPLAQPFGDDLKGSSDAFLSLQARRILANGLARTGGVPLFNQGRAETRDFAWYDHHPPGVALATAAAFGIFGESELVARAVALLFATLSLVVVVAGQKELEGSPRAECGGALPRHGLVLGDHLDVVPTLRRARLLLRAARAAPAARRPVRRR
jgi:hypothetical protein